MQEVKLPSAWIRACLFHSTVQREYIYRIRRDNGEVLEGFAGRHTITNLAPLPFETPTEFKKRIESGDITYTFWGAVETRVIKEQDGVLTVVLPDNKIARVSSKRVVSRDRD